MASQVLTLSIGLISFATAYCYAALENGTLWPKDTEKRREALAYAQEKFWSLDREPLAGFRHAFFETRLGVQLHYVSNNIGQSSDGSRSVVVFIHGFPDSCLLWSHVLASPDLKQYMLVAVDLPGYGGSDSLPAYDAFNVLESVAEFLTNIRRTHGQKLIVISHDWGSLIAARLASETPPNALADHWIITSGMIPHLTVSNVELQASRANRSLSTWTRAPWNFGLLGQAWRAYAPVISQFRKSFYIFCFLLPQPLAGGFATFGNYWFLRACHRHGSGMVAEREGSEAEAMAVSTGPAVAQIKRGGEGYGVTVEQRTYDRGMSQKLRLYREGLFTRAWRISEETMASFPVSQTGSEFTVQASTAPKGSLRTPATIIYGEYDPAFVQSLVLDNAREYLVKGSRVLVVEGAGHWLPLEDTGRRVIKESIVRAVGEGGMDLTGAEGVRMVEAL